MTTSKSSNVKALLFALAATAGLALGACQEEDQDVQASQEIRSACQNYCQRAAECNDETQAPECTDDCAQALGLCEVHEQDEALDQVQECSNESCDDLVGCTINAGAQCVFGLGI